MVVTVRFLKMPAFGVIFFFILVIFTPPQLLQDPFPPDLESSYINRNPGQFVLPQILSGVGPSLECEPATMGHILCSSQFSFTWQLSVANSFSARGWTSG